MKQHRFDQTYSTQCPTVLQQKKASYSLLEKYMTVQIRYCKLTNLSEIEQNQIRKMYNVFVV